MSLLGNSHADECSGEAKGDVLNLQRSADYEVHEQYHVDTQDHSDHSFAGIMFDVDVNSHLPIKVVINAVAVRGTLGHLTVWYTVGGHEGRELSRSLWTKVFDGKKEASPFVYSKIELSTPIELDQGQTIGLYIHSSEHNDSSIVYDNRRQSITHSDTFLSVKSGCAHISPIPFSRQAYGWNRWPWRPCREFVGQIEYGVRYKLWRPVKPVAQCFPVSYTAGAKCVVLCSYRRDCLLSLLPPGVVFYILNMCRWDWFGGLTEREKETAMKGDKEEGAYGEAKVFSWRECDYVTILQRHRERVLVRVGLM